MNTQTIGEKIFQKINYLMLTILSFLFLVPFWVVFATSFVSEAEIARRGSFILFPHNFDFSAYKILMDGGSIIFNAYKNTLFVVIVGTTLNILLTSMLAYGISKKFLPGRKIITLFIFITLLFNGGLIPLYLLNKNLGLIDSRWALILPVLVSAWYTFILRNFFTEIPDSLEEAAFIDGANPITVFFRIILPLSMPALATIGLFYAVTHWNHWFYGAIYINDVKKLPVQNILRSIIINSDIQDIDNSAVNLIENKPTPETIKAAAIIVSTVPILLVYPYIQRYFVKGVMIGSIKG